jgi:DNA methylase
VVLGVLGQGEGIDLPLRRIAAGCRLGGIVLVPFNGACTTGIAARQLGRQYIGVDISPPILRSGDRSDARRRRRRGDVRSEAQRACSGSPLPSFPSAPYHEYRSRDVSPDRVQKADCLPQSLCQTTEFRLDCAPALGCHPTGSTC